MSSARTPRPILAVVLVLLGLGAILQAVPWGVHAASAWTRTPLVSGMAAEPFLELGLLLHRFALVGLLLAAFVGDDAGVPGRVRVGAAFVLLALFASWPEPLHFPEAGPMPPVEQVGRLALLAGAYAVLLWPSWRLGALSTLGVLLPQLGVALDSIAFGSYKNGVYPYGLAGASFALHAAGSLALTVAFAYALWTAITPRLPVAAPAPEPAPREA